MKPLVMFNTNEVISEPPTTQKLLQIMSALIVACALVIMPFQAHAEKERYVLDFNDRYIGNKSGGSTTILLKRALKSQYPWVNTRNINLQKVVLIAKSKHGKGYAQLRVGRQKSDFMRIGGHPKRFKRDTHRTFDRIQLHNPAFSSRGPWQVNLHGHFKVRKIVLITEKRHYRHDYYSWY